MVDKTTLQTLAGYVPSGLQIKGFARVAGGYAAGAITMAGAYHLIDAPTSTGLSGAATQIVSSITQIVDGLSTLAGALSTVAAIGAAAWSAWRASRTQQAKAVAAVPGQLVVALPEIAAATPETNIVSNATHSVSVTRAPS